MFGLANFSFRKFFAISNDISFFDPRNQSGALRTLMIRTSNIGEIMVLVQFHTATQNQIEIILDFLKVSHPEITALLYVVNPKQNDTIFDQNVVCYHGRDYIIESMEDLHFKINY